MRSDIKVTICGDNPLVRRFFEILRPEAGEIRYIGSVSALERPAVGIIVICTFSFDDIIQVRSVSDAPIIYVSERCDEYTMITALTKGADSVVPSDISDIEFAARVCALMRRCPAKAQPLPESSAEITLGPITLIPSAKTVICGGRQIRTTPTEFGILEYLMRHCGIICPAEEIYTAVWKCECFDGRKSVTEHIRRLRRKLGDSAKAPVFIRSVFGTGYVFGSADVSDSNVKTA